MKSYSQCILVFRTHLLKLCSWKKRLAVFLNLLFVFPGLILQHITNIETQANEEDLQMHLGISDLHDDVEIAMVISYCDSRCFCSSQNSALGGRRYLDFSIYF